MNNAERPESPAAREREEQEETAWKKRVKKQLITGALLGASVIGSGLAAVHEANKLDLADKEKELQNAEVKRSHGVVTEKIEVPSHPQTIPTMVGRSIGSVPVFMPPIYSLKVSIEGRDQLVAVEKNVFDAVTIGDKVVMVTNGTSVTVENNEK
jgi:hypothetical protein